MGSIYTVYGWYIYGIWVVYIRYMGGIYEFRKACMAVKNTNIDISWKFDDDKDMQSAFRIACEQK